MSSVTTGAGAAEAPPENHSYDNARDILDARDRDGMRVLSVDMDCQPEILFYLAATGDTEIRSLVASNPGNHFKADEILSDDDEPVVRGALVAKLVDRLARLDPDASARVRASIQKILLRLAEDQAVEVRRIVAEEIKACDHIPANIAKTLANDVDAGVCCPVLQESPLLDDEDLIAVIHAHVCKPALTAIARRSSVSADVSGHIVDTLDVSAVAALLTNPNAQIRETTLDRIIDAADNRVVWHEPLVNRPALSDGAIVKIAGFVADGLLGTLCQRANLSDSVADTLRKKVDDRIAEYALEVREHDAVLDVVEKDLLARRANGRLTAGFIAEAAELENHGVVWVALALLSDTNREFAYRIFKSGSGKAITALTWLADLPAWLSVTLQTTVGAVPEDNCVRPKTANEYPLSPTEMHWQLNLYGYQSLQEQMRAGTSAG